jgi:hypothetical protein
MPLQDHFHPPLYPHHHWDSFHSNWATRIADGIAPLLPADFQVEEHTHAGPAFEIDVATYEKSSAGPAGSPGSSLVAHAAPAYAPPLPDGSMPGVFPDTFEVRVFDTTAGLTLVAVVELVGPGNKDRPEERRAFAVKCASYLTQGVSLIVVDVVTSRRANLHNELLTLVEAGSDLRFAPEVHLYAVSYCPVRRDETNAIDLWRRPLSLGAPLPTLPLRLTGDLFIPIDFEAAYVEACRRRRLA